MTHQKGLGWATVIILILTLAACAEQSPKGIKPPVSLGPTTTSMGNTAIAVGKDGMKYFAWSGCITGERCKISMTWTMAGEPHEIITMPRLPDTTTDYLHPDITVTDTGAIFMTWTEEKAAGMRTNVKSCWGAFSLAGPVAPICNALYSQDVMESAGYPRLASYGQYVYAVYSVYEEEAGGTALLYKQLFPTFNSEGYVSYHSDDPLFPNINLNKNPVLAVSSSGTLHVAWLEYFPELPGGNTKTTFQYANNHGTRYNFIPRSPNASIPAQNLSTIPAIAIDRESSDRVYVAFTSGSRLIGISYLNDGTTTGTLDSELPVKNWNITGKLSIAAYNTQYGSMADVVFVATNTDTSDTEVFLKRFGQAVSAVTSDSINQSNVQTVYVYDRPAGAGGVVRAWFDGSPALVVQSTFPNAGLQTIAGETISPSNTFELAAYDQWVGGIWAQGRRARVSFNIHSLNLPLVMTQ